MNHSNQNRTLVGTKSKKVLQKKRDCSQYNVENSGHDLEACFCDNDLCNSANGRFLQKFLAFSCVLVYVLVLNVFDDFI